MDGDGYRGKDTRPHTPLANVFLESSQCNATTLGHFQYPQDYGSLLLRPAH